MKISSKKVIAKGVLFIKNVNLNYQFSFKHIEKFYQLPLFIRTLECPDLLVFFKIVFFSSETLWIPKKLNLNCKKVLHIIVDFKISQLIILMVCKILFELFVILNFSYVNYLRKPLRKCFTKTRKRKYSQTNEVWGCNSIDKRQLSNFQNHLESLEAPWK